MEIHYGVKEKKEIVKDSAGKEREKIIFEIRSRTNQELAKNYKGGLLIVTGDMDRTVHPSHTLRVVPIIDLVYRWYGTKATSRYGGL